MWFGEEDQLRIMCMKTGTTLLEAGVLQTQARAGRDRGHGVCSGPGVHLRHQLAPPTWALECAPRWSTSSCPDGPDAKVRDTRVERQGRALVVRTVDLSPGSRLLITEGDIIAKLYEGIRLLMEAKACVRSKHNLFGLS